MKLINRKNLTGNRILDGAERLFSDLTFPGMRMEALAEYLGTSRKTLYNHFPGGKREIWRHCVNRQIERFAVKMHSVIDNRDMDFVERGRGLLDLGREAFEVFGGKEGLIRSGEEQELVYPLLRKRYGKAFVEFFREGVERGILAENLPVQTLAEVIVTLITAWGRQGSPLQTGELKSFPVFVEQVLFTGILSEKGRGLLANADSASAAGREA